MNQIFRAEVSCEVSGRTCTIKPKGALMFTNYLSFKKQVGRLASSPIAILDFSEVSRIDHTTMHNFTNLERELGERGLEVKITNMEHLMSESGHPHGDHAVQTQRKLVTKLSKRQSQILFFAGENNCPFIPYASAKMNGWDHFHLLGGKSVVSVENKILVLQHDLKIMVADLLVRTGAYFTEGEQLNTYLSVEFPGTPIPGFRLEEETIMDRLRDSMTQEDIDFDSFEAFSRRFMLRGDDSQSIRDFFTRERIEFFDSLNDLEVESTGNAILLRHTKGLLPPDRYLEWIQLAVSMSEQFRNQPGKAF